MPTDAAADVRTDAPGRRSGSDRFTSERIERIVTFVIGVGSAALAAQALAVWFGEPAAREGMRLVLAVCVFASLALMVAACLAGRLVDPGATLFAIVFPAALLAWPFAVPGGVAFVTDPPWMWFLLNVCTVAAVVAFPLALQIAWAVGVPVLYAAVRIAGAGADGEAIVLDAVFALILGGVLVTLGWMLRAMAHGIDRARVEANAAVAEAADAEAAERERIAVAALMHDSVLAALIAASRSGGDREAALVAAMAREALTRLADADRRAAPGGDDPVPAGALADDLRRSASALGVTAPVTSAIEAGALDVPGPVARALVQAAVQALTNAAEHARGRGVGVTLSADADRVRIVVRDAGDGFDVRAVPDDRLGIRGSIVARMAAVAGSTSIESGPGGTTVALVWEPAP